MATTKNPPAAAAAGRRVNWSKYGVRTRRSDSRHGGGLLPRPGRGPAPGQNRYRSGQTAAAAGIGAGQAVHCRGRNRYWSNCGGGRKRRGSSCRVEAEMCTGSDCCGGQTADTHTHTLTQAREIINTAKTRQTPIGIYGQIASVVKLLQRSNCRSSQTAFRGARAHTHAHAPAHQHKPTSTRTSTHTHKHAHTHSADRRANTTKITQRSTDIGLIVSNKGRFSA